MAHISIIGSGFSGISAAAYLARSGHEVHVYEKNSLPGGRARQLVTDEGYVFDMGPSWYWMPGVFEKFFADFGHKVSDFYLLQLLSPAFEIVFGKNEVMQVPSDFQELLALFESIEPGSAVKLEKFMAEAEAKYKIGMEDLVYRPSLSIREFMSVDVLSKAVRSDIFKSFSKHVRKFFSNEKLIALMEFPTLFLGAEPSRIPALYSLMNYAGLKLGTWYCEGGFGSVISAMKRVAEENGAQFHFDATVEKVFTDGDVVTELLVNGEFYKTDGVIAAADYHHVDSKLLPEGKRNYDESYWKKKTFAPSCLIFYVGVSKKIKKLAHHTLFFDEKLALHAKEIYKDPRWPTKPLFYVCCPSKTDKTVAPQGCENLFLLMPVAPGLNDGEAVREEYFNKMLTRLEAFAGEEIGQWINYKKSYCVSDFVTDYNSYKGNAYGLANTLAQTAIFKPKISNRKIANLFYAGQLTVPGPGVPPSIISGQIAAGLLNKYLSTIQNEVTV